ncbi:concanavalin A-like lectin/glucanase domain-containing protein [Geopyxis carbonaria]|nr:concanavalin A-like lectin/glucanase domain-containing protein [Geopyxis carbonaria]
MSTRSSGVAPNSSYASVLSGQARSFNLHSDLTISGTTSTPQRDTFGSEQSQQHRATVPSYLSESLYAERLASRSSEDLDPSSSSQSMPLPTPGKTSRSHRGLAFDVVENIPFGEQSLNALPSRWNDDDKSSSIELLNGCEARFTGPAKVNEADAAAVRADRHMPPQCGLFYYEITVVSKGKEGLIGIGFCTDKVSLNKLPGWEQESWGYHGDDGNSFCCQGTRKQYGPKFTTNDVIGCGVNFRTNSAFFTKNGVDLGIAFRDIDKGKLFPVVGMKKAGEHIRANFGQEGFVFDIDNYMKMEKARTYHAIHRHSTTKLCPELDETALIQALVSQYLTHDGYVDTARAFAKDIYHERQALDSTSGRSNTHPLDPKGDTDAVNRQKIRNAILQGDVDHALKLTNTFYPKVLEDNELLYFRLRRRKLVEMIRAVSETVQACPKNGHTHEGYIQDMDIDDPVHFGSEWENMEVEDYDSGDAKVEVNNALDAAVEYGQKLRVDFSSDTRPEIKKPLEEAFSLLAYTDPKSSVLAHLLDENGRIADAEELNSAILVSLGKSSVAALERLIKQSSVLVQDISYDGGPGAFVNLRNDYLRDSGAVD